MPFSNSQFLKPPAYEQRQLPPLNDLNQLYPASDFLKQKIHKIDSDEKRRQKLFMLKKLENGSLHL